MTDLKDLKNCPHVTQVLANRQWEGEPVWVVGGGPSLRQFPQHLLHDRHVIGCNQAWKWDSTDIMIACDPRVMERAESEESEWLKRDLVRIVCSRKNQFYFEGCHWMLRYLDRWGKSLEGGVMHYKNTGVAAVNLADILGAGRIYLLGFDLWRPGLEPYKNWHDDYPDSWKPNHEHSDRTLGRWLKMWKHVQKEVGHKVYNVGPVYRLNEHVDMKALTYKEALAWTSTQPTS